MDQAEPWRRFEALLPVIASIPAIGEELIRIYRELSSKVDAQTVRINAPEPRPTLTLKEAIAFVGARSDSGFRKWCKRWGVQRCDHGRYALRALRRGLERQAAARPRPRKVYSRRRVAQDRGIGIQPEAA